MTLAEFMISTIVSGGLLITLLIFFWVRVEIYDCLGGLEMLALLAGFVALLVLFVVLMFYTDDPGLYTRTLGAPQVAQVKELTYITGPRGWGQVRVDTDKGTYLLRSDALVPHSGKVYIVERQRPWGEPRAFVCLSAAAIQCWKEWEPGSID